MAARQLDRPRPALSGVPVFMYHDLCEGAATDRYTASLPQLTLHLGFLREAGFTVCGLEEAQKPLPRGTHRAVLTFDDGLVRQCDLGLRVLVEHGYTATFFVTTSLVDTPGYMTWNQLRGMRTAGMTIGSHGHRHVDHTSMSARQVEEELRRSKGILEEKLIVPANAFSAPFGFVNRTVASVARQAGFKFVCSSLPWPVHPAMTTIPRIVVYKDTTLSDFAGLACGSAWPLVARRARHSVLHVPKLLLRRFAPARFGVGPDPEAQ